MEGGFQSEVVDQRFARAVANFNGGEAFHVKQSIAHGVGDLKFVGVSCNQNAAELLGSFGHFFVSQWGVIVDVVGEHSMLGYVLGVPRDEQQVSFFSKDRATHKNGEVVVFGEGLELVVLVDGLVFGQADTIQAYIFGSTDNVIGVELAFAGIMGLHM